MTLELAALAALHYSSETFYQKYIYIQDRKIIFIIKVYIISEASHSYVGAASLVIVW